MRLRLLVVVLVLAWGAVARADPGDFDEQEPQPAPAARTAPGPWELAAIASYVSPPIHGGTNPFGAGFGGRFGASIGGLYLGVRVVDFLGGQDVDVTDKSVLYSGEVGYGFRLRLPGTVFVTLRPALAAGGVSVFHTDPSTVKASTTSTSRGRSASSVTGVDVITAASGSTSGASSSGGLFSTSAATTTVSNLYLEPTFSVLVSGPVAFVGASGGVMIVPGIAYGGGDPSTWVSYGVEGQIGVSF